MTTNETGSTYYLISNSALCGNIFMAAREEERA